MDDQPRRIAIQGTFVVVAGMVNAFVLTYLVPPGAGQLSDAIARAVITGVVLLAAWWLGGKVADR